MMLYVHGADGRLIAVTPETEAWVIDMQAHLDPLQTWMAPDRTGWIGRRGYCLLLVALQTGMRSSEIIALRRGDIRLGDGAHVRCHGKGRKERSIPLRRDSVAALGAWLKERGGESYDTVFPNQRWQATLARQFRLSPGSELGRRAGSLRVAGGQTGHTPYPAPQRRHGTASQRR